MKLKDRVIEILENNYGSYLSGNEIATRLDVTRAAIWKVMKTLADDGYKIDAISNKGYCLLKENDIISSAGIKKYLKNDIFNFEIFEKVNSTNTVLKEKASQYDIDEGLVIVSSSQTGGYGRKGRDFYSPNDTGVYMSILLKPDLTPETSTLITTSAAVAVSKAIEKIADVDAKIKWVNDIFVNDKKVCGILTQATFNLETNMVDYIILGIGINIYKPKTGFPEDIQNIAGYVLEQEIDDARNKYIAFFLEEFWISYQNLTKKEFVKEYQQRSLLVNREILVLSNNKKTPATSLGVNDDCKLIVKYQDNTIEELSAGEISIKIGENYDNN